ncbi:asparaginase [Streptomyces sp. MUSC 125]|uniref:asparaginase n=1 Tax=Streptomyces sp. MUSC 125 TaxID=1428624 RepID=UPI00057D66AE|nr:asparaginase [Streptomyces sp. MUSC 125]KIE23724.1 asparaginase [Streptomyces sp. MUSC 125]
MTVPVRNVAVFSLGGTIAMTTDPATGGVVPALSAHDLLTAVPTLATSGINLRVRDFRRLPGASLAFEDLTALSAAITTELETGEVDGVVVTQGTDTIEETAFLLDLYHGHEQPVVVTGAMRNPTLPGADGPANLHAAVLAAADPGLTGTGCLVVLGDEVHSARTVRKSHTTSPAAFTSPACGPIARIAENQVRIVGALPRRGPRLDAPARDARVGLYTVTLGDEGALLDLWDGECDGLVVAAFGVGHVPERLVEGLTKLVSRIPVVLASRIGNGPVLSDTYGFPGSEKDLLGRGLISAGDLSPYQARLLLHALLAQGADGAVVRETFAASTR